MDTVFIILIVLLLIAIAVVFGVIIIQGVAFRSGEPVDFLEKYYDEEYKD